MERFKKVYTQGTLDVLEVWVDTETGVNYLYHRTGNAGGLTVLLDEDGKPVVTEALTQITKARAACALHGQLLFCPE